MRPTPRGRPRSRRPAARCAPGGGASSGREGRSPVPPVARDGVLIDLCQGRRAVAGVDGARGVDLDLPVGLELRDAHEAVTDLVRDDYTVDLYAATDFGVLRQPAGLTSWETAGTGLPIVETPGLTMVASARRLYAATHGMGMWYMNLP